MIELPEAMVLAGQLAQEVRGRRIESAVFGSTPHVWAFSNRPPEEYASILAGKVVGEACARGSGIVAPVEPGYALVLGGGGERILLHAEASTLPKKHQLLLAFADGGFLTVSVQGWGSVLLLDAAAVAGHEWVGEGRVSPISAAFTWEHFHSLFTQVARPADSVKYFAITKPGIWGLGNGYLQDILYRARLHPRRRARALTEAEQAAFYEATRVTLRAAVEQGGRSSERDLHDRPGGYHRVLDSTQVGRPCATCRTPIEKIQFLGGACYFCPQCQAL